MRSKLKVILYNLKRQFGSSIRLFSVATRTQNVSTGVSDITYNIRRVTKAIVFPRKRQADFVYDLSYIAANKNFTYGGFFDSCDQIVVLDTNDIKNFTIDLNTIAVINDTKYEIKAIENLQDQLGCILGLRSVTGSPKPEILLSVSSGLVMSHESELA